MDMYTHAKKWLREMADEEGGINALARRIGTSHQKMRRALEGETDPAASAFLNWLESIGAKIVFPDEEDRKLRLVKIPLAGSEIGAGSSFFYDDDDDDEARTYTFREDFINRLNAPVDKLRLFRVRGTSMEPDICSGDVVLVQFKEGVKPRDGDVLVIRVGSELLIKQVFFAPGHKLLLRSKNKDWPDIEVFLDADDFEVIGIPRWVGRQL